MLKHDKRGETVDVLLVFREKLDRTFNVCRKNKKERYRKIMRRRGKNCNTLHLIIIETRYTFSTKIPIARSYHFIHDNEWLLSLMNIYLLREWTNVLY